MRKMTERILINVFIAYAFCKLHIIRSYNFYIKIIIRKRNSIVIVIYWKWNKASHALTRFTPPPHEFSELCHSCWYVWNFFSAKVLIKCPNVYPQNYLMSHKIFDVPTKYWNETIIYIWCEKAKFQSSLLLSLAHYTFSISLFVGKWFTCGTFGYRGRLPPPHPKLKRWIWHCLKINLKV